jgi:hypothetical protein
MLTQMHFEKKLITERIITHSTDKWPLTTLHTMSHQITVTGEGLLTHITEIWTLPTMYKLMSFQIAVRGERFITHITRKWSLGAVCTQM